MSVPACPKCGGPLAADALRCPHCGTTATAARARMQSALLNTIGVLLAIALLVGLVLWLGS